MSYLHKPRIIFSGDFISDVSTVNNDVAHYNNATFIPSFQEFGQGSDNGWWNPEGGATFAFQDCLIKKVCYSDGTSANDSSIDDLVGEFVQGAEGRSAGKMVDLDPQQQGVSELWALRLRIVTKSGEEVLAGDIFPTAFRDLQMRQTDGGKVNGQPLGASWTTVLENIVWGEKAENYRILKELKALTNDNRLAVNLNGFGYYYAHAADGRFSLGKVIGSIGPWFEGEPHTFTAERRLYGTKRTGSSTYFNFSNFRFDEDSSLLSIDFGNSFPISNSLGNVAIKNHYMLGVANSAFSNSPSSTAVDLTTSEFTAIGDLEYSQGDWLMKTGGIIDIKVPQDAIDKLKENQLLLIRKTGSSYTLVARESIDGLNFRADQMVQRIDADDESNVDFYARKWGKPVDSGTISIQRTPPNKTVPGPICPTPGNNFPASGLSFNSTALELGQNGQTQLKITGGRINNPRKYLDGQIYFLGYSLEGTSADPANTGMAGDQISIHLRDYFPVPDRPTWSDISDTMQQFSNLYPIMSKYLVDLASREAVLSKRKILLFAFSQDINSPMYMPVTRDLSEGKRLTIMKWLKSAGANEQTESFAVAEGEAAGAMKSAGKSVGAMRESEAVLADEPTNFHKEIINAMRLKMAQGVSFEAVKDTSKL
ncbi:MAG: hypothetical protein P8P74_10265 [Crocinitomicaceae bacterium]|nr:hypothetical protein [Crocinitomicaceae bacterium]